MRNNKINFNFSFLDNESASQEILPKSDWDGILNNIKSIPTKILLQQYAEPLIVNQSELKISMKNQRFVDMIYNSDKTQYIINACNEFYNQNNSKVNIVCTSNEHNNYNHEDGNNKCENKDKAKEILDSIFSKLEICENEVDKMTAYKADMLISNLKNYIDNLNSDALNSYIVMDLQTISNNLILSNKRIEALKLLNFAYSIADTDKLRKSIQKDIDKLKDKKYDQAEEELPFTKIRYGERSDINWKPLVIISVVVIISCFIGFISHQNLVRKNAISQIKNNAYEYLKKGNEYDCNSELDKLSQYGIDTDSAKNELIDKYEKEKQRIISDIAYNYEHNKEMFESLKQKYLSILFDNDENKFNQVIEEKLGYKELSLKTVPLPKSGVIHNYTGKEAIAPFEIITQASENNDPLGLYNDNYYIKLVDPYTDKTEVVIFVRGGETIKMDIPLGTYKIKRASGNTWYGEENLFGHNTVYTTSDQWLTFRISGSYVEGHTLTLYKVANGNFSTKDIKAEDF